MANVDKQLIDNVQIRSQNADEFIHVINNLDTRNDTNVCDFATNRNCVNYCTRFIHSYAWRNAPVYEIPIPC